MEFDWKEYVKSACKDMEKTLKENIRHKDIEDIKVSWLLSDIDETVNTQKHLKCKRFIIGFVDISVVLKEEEESNGIQG